VIEELDDSRPPDLSKAILRLMYWTAARRTRELVVTTKQTTDYFRTRPLGEEPELHGYLKTGLHVRRLLRVIQ
jgi:hypothetical protein